MYGDTEVMRRRVDQLREQAVDVRMLADQLVARTESLGWTGRAAESMRVRVTERATHLRSAAGDHETAADSLEKHLQEVERLTEAIAAVERRATSMVTEARARVEKVEQANEADAAAGTGVHRDPDPDDVTLAAFSAPPSGHRDWLTLTLPGL